MRREECDRMVELVQALGAPGMQHLRETLRTGQPRQAAAVVGVLSRLDVPTLLELLPVRLPEWNRFYHDIVVRQIAYGAASDRGRTLLELLEILDPMVVPQALDEIGMSGDRSAAPPLMVIAEAGEAQGRSPLLQLKAVESLGRLREPESVPVLRNILETKKMWKWVSHRELRIAAAQALAKIDPRFGGKSCQTAGLEPAELAIAPLDAAPACPWVRQRRYERVVLAKPLSDHQQFLGQVRHSGPGAEPGRRHGREGRQSARGLGSEYRDLGRRAPHSRPSAAAPRAGQRSRL